MRWYDLDPNVCMAISMIEMAEKDIQTDCAKFILKSIAECSNNYAIKNIVALNEKHYHPQNRWTDKNVFLTKAFDCLKEAPKDVQKTVSLSVLNLLNAVCV